MVILGHADQALYYAKDHGRNLVCQDEALLNQGHLHADRKSVSVEFFFDEPAES